MSEEIQPKRGGWEWLAAVASFVFAGLSVATGFVLTTDSLLDITRATLWVLLPFCIVGSLFLVSQGVIQNLRPYDIAKLVDPQTKEVTEQCGNPLLAGADQTVTALQPGGN